MKSSMIAGVREGCGLGNPSLEYTQNANECISSILNKNKEKVTLSIKETVRLMQKEVNNQNLQISAKERGRSVASLQASCKLKRGSSTS